MDYYGKQVLLWSIVATLATIVILACLASFTKGPLANRISCAPLYPTCTHGVNSWNTGLETCRCEKLPEAP